MAADIAPTFEYVPTGTIPGSAGVYRGPEGYKEFLSGFWDQFQDARIEVRELIEAGDQVLASITMHGRGKQRDVEARWDIWQLWTLREGKGVCGQEVFTTRDAASRSRRAAGVALRTTAYLNRGLRSSRGGEWL